MNTREARSGAIVVLAISRRLDGFSVPALEAHVEIHQTVADACS